MDKIDINKIKDNILNLPGYKLKDINSVIFIKI